MMWRRRFRRPLKELWTALIERPRQAGHLLIRWLLMLKEVRSQGRSPLRLAESVEEAGQWQLSRPDKPAASIIIPVFNHAAMTMACLRSIVTAKTGCSYEIIVIDDASSEQGVGDISRLEGLVFARNPRNSGFVDSCNRGAELARGPVLVFLNNDTRVLDDWVDHLLEALDQPGVGLVGSCLVFPDGTVQEAGGIIFSDGSAWNHGRGADPQDPRYCYRRDADYCSGAAIAISAESFAAAGGFSNRYSPAYYEDTDLAMRMRSMGQRVVYQPKAVVVHVEGATAGTDISSGMKAYQVINQRKFLDYWGEQLRALHSPPGTHPDRAVRASARWRVVAVCTRIEAHFSTLLRLLVQAGCAVDLHILEDTASADVRDLRDHGICVWPRVWLASARWMLVTTGTDANALLADRTDASMKWIAGLRSDAPEALLLQADMGNGSHPHADTTWVQSMEDVIRLLADPSKSLQR